MSSYKNFSDWRKRTKQKLVEAFGNCCGICGYSRCIRNLSFHHIDPAEKEFTLAIRGSRSWARLVAEVRKCVLLCANCHGEVHAGITIIPADCRHFDEAYAGDIRGTQRCRVLGHCKTCGAALTSKHAKVYCSLTCCASSPSHPKNRLRPSEERLRQELALNLFKTANVAKVFHVTDRCVRKWVAHYGINLADRRKIGTLSQSRTEVARLSGACSTVELTEQNKKPGLGRISQVSEDVAVAFAPSPPSAIVAR